MYFVFQSGPILWRKKNSPFGSTALLLSMLFHGPMWKGKKIRKAHSSCPSMCLCRRAKRRKSTLSLPSSLPIWTAWVLTHSLHMSVWKVVMHKSMGKSRTFTNPLTWKKHDVVDFISTSLINVTDSWQCGCALWCCWCQERTLLFLNLSHALLFQMVWL